MRHRPDGLPRARTQPPVPEMPANVRLLFQPVLRPREGRSGKDPNREPNFKPGRSPDGHEAFDLPSRPVHAPAVQVWPAGRGEGAAPARRGKGAAPAGSTERAAPAGSTLTTQGPPSGGWQAERSVGASLATTGSPAVEGKQAGRGRRPHTGVLDRRPTQPQAGRGVRHGRSRAGLGMAAGPGYRRHLAWMAALTVLLFVTAAGTTVALLRQHGGGKPAVGGGAGARGAGGAGGAGGWSGVTALAAAADSRAAAARWVSREITRGAIIGCDTVMCDALIKSGVPSADLLVITPSSQDPLGVDVVIATAVLESQFGSRLSTEYAPAVLASFGTGKTRVQVREVAAYGASAYRLALNRDLAARELLGTQLIGNKRIALPVGAKTEFAAGQVDPRLLITLPALAQRHPIRVLAFYDRAPGASSGVPLAGVRLAGWDPEAGLPAHAYLRWLVSFLRSQRSVYRAADVATTWRHGRAIVSVRFARPNPIGLLN